jgi:hypothetical protein
MFQTVTSPLSRHALGIGLAQLVNIKIYQGANYEGHFTPISFVAVGSFRI